MVRCLPSQSRWLLLALLTAAPCFAQAQTGSVGIGTTTPTASAALDIVSTSKGLLLPRLSLAQRMAMGTGTIAAPVAGLVIFQTDNTPGLYAYDGTAWVRLGADNLGNHLATQALNLGANALVGNGGTTGLSIDNAGNAQLPAANAYRYAAAKSYTVAYGPNDFQPADVSPANAKYVDNQSGTESVYGTTTGSLRVLLHLPQGAVVTSLVLIYQDYNNGGAPFGVGLAMVANYIAGPSQTLASFSSTGRPGYTQATIPVGSIIDNTTTVYSLRATFGYSTPAVSIYGVKVNYTVRQAE